MNQIATFRANLADFGLFSSNLNPHYRFIWIIHNITLTLRYEPRAKRAEYEK